MKGKKSQKLRISVKKADRRSGKTKKPESKVSAAKSKKKFTVSQKRSATIKKSRY